MRDPLIFLTFIIFSIFNCNTFNFFNAFSIFKLKVLKVLKNKEIWEPRLSTFKHFGLGPLMDGVEKDSSGDLMLGFKNKYKIERN